MTSPRGPWSLARPALRYGALAAGLALALAGCAPSAEPEVSSPTGGAIAACLSAARDQFGFPADGTTGLDVSMTVDTRGWWAVHATTSDGAKELTLTCTAVPDQGPLGARAASFSVSGR